jgi:hypothetical protein
LEFGGWVPCLPGFCFRNSEFGFPIPVLCLASAFFLSKYSSLSFFQLLSFLPELLFDSSIAFLVSEFVEGGGVIFHFSDYYFTTVRNGAQI